MSLFRNSKAALFSRVVRKFTPGPPRHINEARLTTVDRKICILTWDGRNQISLTLQDRASSLTFPLSVARHAGKFVACYQDGGMCSLKPSKEAGMELRVGSDRGILYFSLKSDDTTITTGLGPGDAAVAASLLRFAEQSRVDRACT